MTNPTAPPSPGSKDELREFVLKYFDTPDGRLVQGIGKQPQFEWWSNAEVLNMVRALHTAGLLTVIGGESRDRAYKTKR